MKILNEEKVNSITVELETSISPNFDREDSKIFAKYLKKLKISYKESKKQHLNVGFGFYTGSIKNIIKLMKDYWDYNSDDILEVFENS